MAEFSNPNQQGGHDNRSMVAMMVLVVAILFGAQYYHTKTNPPAAAPTAAPNAAQAPAKPVASSPAASSPAVAAAKPVQRKSAKPEKVSAAAAPVVEASSATTTVIENELYRITFSNRGAEVTSWVLKQYKNADGRPLDLVHDQAAKLFGYPMSLYTYDGSSVSITTASRKGDVVTLTTAADLPPDMNGQGVSVAGVSDSSYNGTYAATVTGPNTLTYVQDDESGHDSSSTGGTLSRTNGALGEQLSRALFVPSATGQLTVPATLTFKYSKGDLTATKTFRFDASYVLHADVEVTRNGAPVRALLSWPGGFGDQDDRESYASVQFDSYSLGKDQHLAPKKITGGGTLDGPFQWAGVSDAFFAAEFLPDNPAQATVATLRGDMNVAKTELRTGIGSGSPPKGPIQVQTLGAALGGLNGVTSMRIFVGPKAINVLKGVHAADPKVTLEPALDFGFWGFIGKYLFLALQAVHSMVAGLSGSWGWAIVILTVLINVLMLPLRVMTMKSAVKMQRIQPQMDAIKERYKKYKVTDPKRNEMNAEVMALQKKEGVNMFGGCIPSLITFPFLMAFFYMIPKVVELRNAHWYWLPNLQAADPLHILPIVMVVSQFLVQFYTPSPGVDPQQQKMMAFMMPAFSGYICWNYQSGLALYWAIGNLIGIAQQGVMNRTSMGREMREIAAKRARRKAAGKATTIQARK